MAIALLSACQPATTSAPSPILPAEPQEISITTRYGHELNAKYFPGKTATAPIIVLMHWSGGSLGDWDAIARWLQNRGLEPSPGENRSWTDANWFPTLGEETSFAVLSFDYWGLGGLSGTNVFLRDSVDAVAYASTLPGIDPDRIITAGSSIGADGAIDGCYLFNQMVAAGKAAGHCAGAFSFSPGNYLGAPFSYQDAAVSLSDAGSQVYCLAADEDMLAVDACAAINSVNFYLYRYEGGAHGMQLIDPSLFPYSPDIEKNSLQILLEFLENVTDLR